MRWLLVLLVAVLVYCDMFDVGLSLAPGLSVKNGVVYVIAAGLFFRSVLSGEVRIELPSIHGLFAAWIGYALVTMLVVALMLHYPNYHLSTAVIDFKTLLVDPAVLCLTVFYGLRNRDDVRVFLKGLAAAMCIASVLTLADVAGLVHITMRVGESGIENERVYGFFGHANETGTLVACMLPLMLALAASGRKSVRALWYAGAFASAVVLIMTVSRGAFVAAFVALIWGAYLCRGYIRISTFFGWTVAALALIVVVVGVANLIDPQMSGELYRRLVSQSATPDVGTFTSGRTGIWLTAIETMMATPLSLITGFGWDAYESMPFLLATHNYYLTLWFDLGIFGVAMFILIVRRALRLALDALPHSSGDERRFLLAFPFGMIAMLVGVFFTLILKPWPYFWLYVGAMMRVALIVESAWQPEATPIDVAPIETTARATARSVSPRARRPRIAARIPER